MTEKKSFRILAIDDEQPMLDLLKEALCEAGHGVVVANNGKEGLRHFRDNCPDLVILDVAMPVMDGYEVLNQIREESDVPVLMLTGRAPLKQVLDSDKHQIPDSYFEKGAPISKLLSTVDYLLNM